HYEALGSLLRSKASLISLAAKYVSPEDDDLTLLGNIYPPKKIIAELQDYHDELFPFSKNEWNFFEGDILNASVERLFSSIGFFHTKTRNRLSPDKVLNMSKLRASMLYKDRIEKIKDKGDDELNEDFISNTVEWSRVLDTWFSMIDNEENANQLYYKDDELDMTNLTT
ncbi:18802_t:CDS:2, partial [Gigaspora margarita]